MAPATNNFPSGCYVTMVAQTIITTGIKYKVVRLSLI